MESTEVLYDPSEIVRRVVERCYTVKYTMDGCIDANGSSVLTIPDHPVTKAFIDMKDDELCLTVEVKADDESGMGLGLATYSNSEPTEPMHRYLRIYGCKQS